MPEEDREAGGGVEAPATPPPPTPAAVTRPDENGDGSHLAKLRARREAIARAKPLELDIPGYGGDLVGRYIKPEWDAIRRISDQWNDSKHPRAVLYGQADVIILACDELLARKGDGTLGHLDPNDPTPVRFDERLGTILGFAEKPKSARDALLMCFGNDMAVGGHHEEIVKWFSDVTKSSDEEFAGESEGNTT